jgi:ppGpp synthetase/RelA/SpoT-type nucleotidyltranferase
VSVNVLSDRYALEEPHLLNALKEWKKALRSLAQPIDQNVVVDGRVKQLRSLLSKAYKNGPTSPRSWETFGDLVALKAVFPTRVGAETFTDLLQSTADANGIWCKLERRVPEPNKLAYAANQFDLCDSSISDAGGSGIKVEVQVRTVAADAWYMIDHRLNYKGATKLSDGLQRRVLRLIVLAELFDSEVDSLIRDVKQFESDQLAGLYNEINEVFSAFTQSYAPAARPEGLFETLLSAYSAPDREQLVERIRALIANDGDHLRQVMSEHRAGAKNYVEQYDWLYMEPEALLVADLAKRPRHLASVVQNTDFDRIVTGMIDELKAK